MVEKVKMQKVIIYQGKDGQIELQADVRHDTVWATLDQIASLFGRDKSVISRHLKNVFFSDELNRDSVVAKNATTASDGKTYIVEHYNLDAILSVGYRVNSKKATQFRKWATKVLRGYMVDGYAINKKRIVKNYAQFLGVIDDIKKLLPSDSAINPKDAVELVSLFADTWLSLDAYDRGLVPKGKLTKKKVDLTAEKISKDLALFRTVLMQRGEATNVFGNERQTGSVSGIVGNVMQSFGGRELYSTVEEKAAHLLYFIVKDHPFTDGNKRSGAFAFVWLLKQAKVLNITKLTPSALTALTILVAESNPGHKDKIIKLILDLISEK